MNREIKFRAWDKINKQMCEVKGIDFIRDMILCFPLTKRLARDEQWRDMHSFELIQWTGMLDSKGNEIFPHSIIKWNSMFPDPLIGEVIEVWGKCGPSEGPNVMNYILRCASSYFYPNGNIIHNLWHLSQMEVIGDTYTTPELMECKKQKPRQNLRDNEGALRMSTNFKEFAEYGINRLRFGFFQYTRENGRKIAPCGSARKCKNHHRKCADSDNCDRVNTCPEKANMRLWYETHLRGWKKKPNRLRQIIHQWEREYRNIESRTKCKDCKLEYCSTNGVQNPKCWVAIEGKC